MKVFSRRFAGSWICLVGLLLALVLPGRAGEIHDDQVGEVIEGLMSNPGLERVENGWPADWVTSLQGRALQHHGIPEGRGVYSLSDQAHSGKHSLEASNDDPKRYILCAVPFDYSKLKTGELYVLEAWVKTKDLTGKAVVQTEHWRHDGQYAGGMGGKLEVPVGTRDWTRYRMVFRSRGPSQAAESFLLCYLDHNATGTAWFDDIVIREFVPDFAAGLLTDKYRHTTAGGPVVVRAGLKLREAGVSRVAISAELAVLNPDSKAVAKHQPTAITDAWVQFDLDSSSLPVGEYTLQATVRAEGRKRPIELTCPLRRVKTLPNRKVYFDKHHRLIVEGKAMFPLGVYTNIGYLKRKAKWVGKPASHYKRLTEAGFNCVMSYSSPSTEDLDQLRDHGLGCMYTIKEFAPSRYRKTLQTPADELEYVREYVTKHRDHPAVWAWYAADEEQVNVVPRIKKRYRLIEQLDPNHPAWIVNNRYDNALEFADTADVIAGDPYPIPSFDLLSLTRYSRAIRRGTLGLQPFWMVPQISNKGNYRSIERSRLYYRAPTYPELQNMAWQCIANGANGLIFYSYYDLWVTQLRKQEFFDAQWTRVAKMAREIHELKPVLLSVEPAPQPSEVQCNAEAVSWRIWKHNGDVYLLVVNGGNNPEPVSMTFPVAFAENKPVLGFVRADLNGKALSLTLDPREVRMFRLAETP